MGTIEPFDFVSFEQTVDLFETEWSQIAKALQAKGKKS
jgi:hypothetical protein